MTDYKCPVCDLNRDYCEYQLYLKSLERKKHEDKQLQSKRKGALQDGQDKNS
jgi:hypothetical protein